MSNVAAGHLFYSYLGKNTQIDRELYGGYFKNENGKIVWSLEKLWVITWIWREWKEGFVDKERGGGYFCDICPTH